MVSRGFIAAKRRKAFCSAGRGYEWLRACAYLCTSLYLCISMNKIMHCAAVDECANIYIGMLNMVCGETFVLASVI